MLPTKNCFIPFLLDPELKRSVFGDNLSVIARKIPEKEHNHGGRIYTE